METACAEVVSVLICTRDRPESLIRQLRALVGRPSDEKLAIPRQVIVVDQSEGSQTRLAVAGFESRERVQFVSSRTRGKGGALNEGLACARGKILVCTDDDCEAPPGWADGMTRALKEQESAAVLYCQVLGGPVADPRAGYIPTFHVPQNRLVRRFSEIGRFGLGAGMAVRVDVVRALGGFDGTFGPGSLYPSCDDWDIGQRVLLRGWHIYESKDLVTIHHGFRLFAEGREHARRDWLAIGAMCARPLRAGHGATLSLTLRIFLAQAAWPLVTNTLTLRRERGLTRVLAFMQGFARGLRMPVDPHTLCFSPRAPARRG